MTVPDPAVAHAALNNAVWCAAMCRSHGIAGQFGPQAWTAPTRTPPLYPDAVTLTPGADVDELLLRIDVAASGASVKDSFADLDLRKAGFRVLFEAQWLHRPADATVPSSDLAWGTVTDPQRLRAWASAWDRGEGHERLFRPQLLDDTHTVVLTGEDDRGEIVAGAVASQSEQVVGISNLFARRGGADTAWPVVLQAVATLFPRLPIVSYDHGESLMSAVRHGFRRTGPLRVWLQQE